MDTEFLQVEQKIKSREAPLDYCDYCAEWGKHTNYDLHYINHPDKVALTSVCAECGKRCYHRLSCGPLIWNLKVAPLAQKK